MTERAAQYCPSTFHGRNLGNLGQERKVTAHAKTLIKVYKTSIVHKDVHFIFSMFMKVSSNGGLSYAKINLPDITVRYIPHIHHQSLH